MNQSVYQKNQLNHVPINLVPGVVLGTMKSFTFIAVAIKLKTIELKSYKAYSLQNIY